MTDAGLTTLHEAIARAGPGYQLRGAIDGRVVGTEVEVGAIIALIPCRTEPPPLRLSASDTSNHRSVPRVVSDQ
jgi:hypothetical protein